MLAASRCWRGLGGVSSSPMRSRSTDSLILDLWPPERRAGTACRSEPPALLQQLQDTNPDGDTQGYLKAEGAGVSSPPGGLPQGQDRDPGGTGTQQPWAEPSGPWQVGKVTCHHVCVLRAQRALKHKSQRSTWNRPGAAGQPTQDRPPQGPLAVRGGSFLPIADQLQPRFWSPRQPPNPVPRDHSPSAAPQADVRTASPRRDSELLVD